MSTSPGNSTHPAAKVTISPVGDPSRGTDALIVTIKTVDAPPPSEFKASSLKNIKRHSKSSSIAKIASDRSAKNSTMSDKSKVAGSPKSQTGKSVPSATVASSEENSTQCIRHAAENIARKASDIPSEKISLCNNCSKSMLSYIFVVQDFLDSLAKEICGNTDSKRCIQCEREELRKSLSSSNESPYQRHEEMARRDGNADSRSSPKPSLEKAKSGEGSESSGKKTSRTKSHRKRDDAIRSIGQQTYSPQQSQQVDFLYNVSSSAGSTSSSNRPFPDQARGGGETSEHRNVPPNPDYKQNRQQQHYEAKTEDPMAGNQDNWYDNQRRQRHDSQESKHVPPPSGGTQSIGGQHNASSNQPVTNFKAQQSSSEHRDQSGAVFVKPMERSQPNQQPAFPTNNQQTSFQANSQQQSFPSNVREPGHGDFPVAENPPSLYDENVDGIMSTLSHVEREVYDTARNRAGWESLTESQERLGSSPSGQIASEAFVTLCRNNAEAMGCLALGASLLLTRTSRTLCVLVSDGVSNAFRGPLSAVFNVVQYVRAMDSLGTTKLALLEQPELGISFDKLNIWRLSQFSKCVYINPDALVIQNCDELFCHEELSAVPDIGWPDCFNSGVFVFSPSVHTFWQLLEFAEKQGSYDGGDQGLLNSFFNFWSHDINRKLSFIYNLMANVSYTYTPAFTQFGRNVKIVQFHGSFKPWHVKFFSSTGQIAPASTVHPTYVQFVHIWLNIFRISVLRLLSQEIQSYAASQKTICSIELLRFFPLPSESEAEFYLTPPSVRVRLAEKRLQRTTTPLSEAQRRKSADFPVSTPPKDEETETESKAEDSAPTDDENKATDVEKKESDDVSQKVETSEPSGKEKSKTKDENTLPGSEVGDYQGMKAWEQGRMDYQGSASSENIIKRLEFLMSQNK